MGVERCSTTAGSLNETTAGWQRNWESINVLLRFLPAELPARLKEKAPSPEPAVEPVTPETPAPPPLPPTDRRRLV